MSAPKVSVIIPAYNAEAFVSQAIDSVLEQTYPHIEVIVVNDGSTDATPEILETYKSKIRIISQSNRGLPVARNAGLKHVTGTLISFLDSDDLYTKDRLEAQVHCFLENDDLDVCVGAVSVFEEGIPDRLTAQGNAQMVATRLFSKSALDRVGLFNEQLGMGESIDWLLRAEACKLTEIQIQKTVLLRRSHANNMTRTESPEGYMKMVKEHLLRQKKLRYDAEK